MPVTYFSKRWLRFIRHIVYPIYKSPNHLNPDSILDWFVDCLFYIMDLLLFPEIFILLNYLIKFRNVRKLNDYEKFICKSFYGDLISLDKVIVDDKSFLTKNHRFAFVSFNMINYYGRIKDETLIHEMVHVYQFQKFGFVYVYRALKAQFSKDAYDYGGYTALIEAIQNKKSIFDFNFEQQASIIEHYFVITQDEELRANEELVLVYKKFFDELGMNE